MHVTSSQFTCERATHATHDRLVMRIDPRSSRVGGERARARDWRTRIQSELSSRLRVESTRPLMYFVLRSSLSLSPSLSPPLWRRYISSRLWTEFLSTDKVIDRHFPWHKHTFKYCICIIVVIHNMLEFRRLLFQIFCHYNTRVSNTYFISCFVFNFFVNIATHFQIDISSLRNQTMSILFCFLFFIKIKLLYIYYSTFYTF